MPETSEKSLKRIGIECESIEDDAYGVARLISGLLKELAMRPALVRTHRFVLYFNRKIPDVAFLQNPLFETRLVGLSRWGLPGSFSLYYYVLLPLEVWRNKPAAMYYPNYMLPVIHPLRVPSLVMMTEDIFSEAHNRKLPLRYRLAYRIFSLFWAKRFATRIIAISRSSRDALMARGIARSRIAVNELAVDAPRADVQPSAGTYVLWVGQAFQRRHLKETLAAFTALASEMPTLSFRIVGPDRYEPPFIAEAVGLMNQRLARTAVIWERQVSEEQLATRYAGASALVYVSDTEAFGLPPLEALSYGAAPVVFDAPVSREVFGEHAFYAGEPTVAAIGTAIRNALTDTRRIAALKKAAPGILERYTWKANANRFLKILETLTQ